MRIYHFFLLISFCCLVASKVPVSIGRPSEEVIELDVDESSNDMKTLHLDDIEMSLLGKNIRPIQKADGRDGTAYITTKNITNEEEIFHISLDDVMSMESASEGRINVFLEANPTLPDAIVLALHLMEEKVKGEDSKYYHFISRMSRKINSALFFTEDELNTLKGSQLLRMLSARVEAINKFYDTLKEPLISSEAVDPPLFSEDDFTLENFQWAMGTVWSRSIVLRAGDDKFEAYLAPVFDNIGICQECSTDIRVSREKNQIIAYATQDYASGEEMKINMGQLSTIMYMMNYGISMKPTIFDTIPMAIQVDTADALYEQKVEKLKVLNMTMNDSYVLTLEEKLPDNMMKSMRVKLIIDSEKDKWEDALDGERVSLRNEYAVCRSIYQSIITMLTNYPTTLEEDETFLKFHEENSRDYHIHQSLIIEKKILLAAKNAITKYWENLLQEDLLE